MFEKCVCVLVLHVTYFIRQKDETVEANDTFKPLVMWTWFDLRTNSVSSTDRYENSSLVLLTRTREEISAGMWAGQLSSQIICQPLKLSLNQPAMCMVWGLQGSLCLHLQGERWMMQVPIKTDINQPNYKTSHARWQFVACYFSVSQSVSQSVGKFALSHKRQTPPY